MSLKVYIIVILEQLFALFLVCSGLRDSKIPADYSPAAVIKKFITTVIPCAFLISLAFMLRVHFFDYETTDYTWFLQKWVEFYRTNGGFHALDESVGNYNIPYLYFLSWFSYSDINDLYLIKLLSIFFDVILAGVSMALAKKCGAGKKAGLICFFVILFLPTVFMNGAVWAQCDSIYVSLALLGIYFALDDKPILSMISISFSFGFKLQAVFVMPVFLILWFARKLKWQHALIFPAAYLLLILPALIAGRPFREAIMLYVDQADTVGSAMNYNSPSVFGIVQNISDVDRASAAGIVLAFAAMIIIILLALANRKYLTPRVILFFSLLLTAAIPFFLPHMHDRYFYSVDVLSVILACAAWKTFPAAIFAQFASLICYLAYFKTYYLQIGRTYLTPDKGAWALIIAMIIWVIQTSLELTKARKSAEKKLLRKK